LVQKKRFEFGRSALVSTFSSRDYFRLTLPETAKNNITRSSAGLPPRYCIEDHDSTV